MINTETAFPESYTLLAIESVEDFGVEQTYDLEIETVHAFSARNEKSGAESVSHNSAMIALFDMDDDDMLTCKFGNWWELNPQRGRANNTAVIVRHKIEKDVFLTLWKKIELSGSGEPGFMFTNDANWGLNPCLTGDTMVAVADGRGYVSFKDLANDGKDVPVFTLDDNGIIKSAWMRRPRLTGTQMPIYKITLDDGNIIRATENHKFPLKSGQIKQVKELVAGDSLRTMVKFESKLWSNKNSQKYTFIRSGKTTRAEHRVIAEHAYNVDLLGNSETMTVHHKDFNSKNNSPNNLEVMTVEAHNILHSDRMRGKNNPVHKILNSDRAEEYIRKLSKATSGNNNPNFSGISNDELYQHALWLTMSLGRIAFISDWQLYAKQHGLPQNFSGWRKTHLGEMAGFLRKAAIDCGMLVYDTIDVRIVKALHYYLSQGYDCFIDDETGKLLFNKICEYSNEPFVTEIPEAAVKHEYAKEYSAKMQWKTQRASMMSAITESHNIRKSSIRELQSQVYNDLKFSLGREPHKTEWSVACKNKDISTEISRRSSPFNSYNSLKEYAATSNHKVISVEFDGCEDVYNGTVDTHHNFFIGQYNTNGNIVSINTMNCAEISLRPFQFCNLCEINVSNLRNQEDLNNRAKASAFIGTLQASYTDFHYLRDIWKKTTEKEALIGVGQTGIASGAVLKLDMEEAARIVKKENEIIAGIIGINKAARTTTVKPSGTTSLVLGTSSGIHAWHNDYYIRRVRVGKNESLYAHLLLNHPELVEDEFFKPHQQAVISIPQRAPEGAITRQESALDLLERVSTVWNKWVKPGHRKGENKNNVSVTVSIKPDEWEEVGEWMWTHKENFTALSVLPYDGGSYIQAPFEDCTKEKYEELVSHLHDIDLTQVVELNDETNLSDELACAAGGCEVI